MLSLGPSAPPPSLPTPARAGSLRAPVGRSPSSQPQGEAVRSCRPLPCPHRGQVVSRCTSARVCSHLVPLPTCAQIPQVPVVRSRPQPPRAPSPQRPSEQGWGQPPPPAKATAASPGAVTTGPCLGPTLGSAACTPPQPPGQARPHRAGETGGRCAWGRGGRCLAPSLPRVHLAQPRGRQSRYPAEVPCPGLVGRRRGAAFSGSPRA